MANLFRFGFSTDKKQPTEKRKGSSESKKEYEKSKRKRVFCEKWRDDFEWLKYDQTDNVMFCLACREASDTGRFVDGTDNFRIDTIKLHNESPSHTLNFRKFQIKNRPANSTVITSHTGECVQLDTDRQAGVICHPAVVGPMDAAMRKIGDEQKDQLITCFNTAYFTVKEELPFTMYPSLLSLQKKNGVIIPNSYGTDQACRRFVTYIHDDIHGQSTQLIENARVLSVMFDGATDVSISENEIVYVRIVENGIPKNLFVQIAAVEHAHAEGVLSAIDSAMNSVDPAWKQKLIATGSDGASVNLGKRHSVAKLLKDEVPHLFAMHCISHRLELGAIDTMKQRDGKLFDDVKSVLKSLHHHYHYSPKALRELRLIADALGEKMTKPANLSGTRWMPHLSRCLQILLSKYTVFVNHFENTVEGRIGTVDVQSRARQILKHLKDYRLLRYLHFIKVLLDILSDLSLQFQRDSCGIPEATDALETACLRLTALHQRPGSNLQKFLDDVSVEHKFRDVQLTPPTLSEEQMKRKQDELTNLVIDHICNRVGDIDSDRLLKAMQIFYPINLPAAQVDRAVYGEDSLRTLCGHYSDVLQRMGCDTQQMQDVEWPALKVHMNRQPKEIGVQDLYNRLFSNANLKEKFKNILMLAEIVLCIPVSSALCERGFSAMARIKSDWRARLDVEMLNRLMAISIEGPTAEDYNAQRAVELWWNGGQRARRPDFD